MRQRQSGAGSRQLQGRTPKMSGHSGALKGRWLLRDGSSGPGAAGPAGATHSREENSRFVRPCLTPGCLGCRLALPSASTLRANRCGCSEDATMQQTGLSPSHLIAQSRCKSRSVRKMEHFKGEMENNTQLAPPQQPSCAS